MTRLQLTSAIGFACCIACGPSAANGQTPQPPAPPTWQQEATAAENATDFKRAIALYRAQLEATPNSTPIKLSLGRALRLDGRPAEARKVFEEVLTANPSNIRALLGLAVVEAQAGNNPAANGWIGKAVEAGALPLQLETPTELAQLRQTPEYRSHLERANRLANPCRFEKEYAQFDFWTGDWDIYVNGQLIARNIVTREMNGCIIHERYRTTNGAIRGESINYYDPLERAWKQNWVSNGGNVIAYTGKSPREGVMQLNGTSVSPGVPGTQLQRVTWERLADGGLTQTVSVSNDDGKTWSPGFAGRYVRSSRPIQSMNPDENYPVNSALSAGTKVPSAGR